MRPDRRLDEFAARQYGAFSLDQARGAGFTSKMVENRTSSGAWVRLASGVYALASAPPKWERQLAAALLSRPGSVVAGRSAAHLHGFPEFNTTRPVIMIGTSGNGRSSIATVIRSKAFDSIRRTRVRGFEVTHPADTIVTLSRELDAVRLGSVVDDCLSAGLTTVEELELALGSWAGWPGITKLRPVISERSVDAYQPPTTELERLLQRVMAHPSMPSHTRQVPFDFESVSMTVDAYVPAWRLIVEADGRRWHIRVADFERDRRRDNEALAHGLGVLRFTYRMLRDEPEGTLNTLLRVGRSRIGAAD